MPNSDLLLCLGGIKTVRKQGQVSQLGHVFLLPTAGLFFFSTLQYDFTHLLISILEFYFQSPYATFQQAVI